MSITVQDIRQILSNKLNGEGSSYSKEEILQEVIQYIDDSTKVLNPNFNRNIAWFDLETSGMVPEKHRILEIAISVYSPSGELVDSFYSMINPYDGFGEPEISDEAMKITGIDLEECKKGPTLLAVSTKIKSLLENNDLGGYNIENFDLPFLVEQFHRIENPLNLSNCKIVDIYKILIKAEPRKLTNISERFLGRKPEAAHTALDDVKTTYEVCSKILNEFGLTNLNNQELQEFAFGTDSYFDVNKKLKKVIVDGKPVDAQFTFGKKYVGHFFSSVCKTDPGYLDWILKNDFSQDTKMWVYKLKKYFTSK